MLAALLVASSAVLPSVCVRTPSCAVHVLLHGGFIRTRRVIHTRVYWIYSVQTTLTSSDFENKAGGLYLPYACNKQAQSGGASYG